MSLRHRIGRLERKLGSATEDPRIRDMWKELEAEKRRRDALRIACLNLARHMWVRAGHPERAAGITLNNLAGQMESRRFVHSVRDTASRYGLLQPGSWRMREPGRRLRATRTTRRLRRKEKNVPRPQGGA